MYFTRTSGWHTARARRSRRGVRRPPRGGRGRRAAAPPPPARARRAARRPPCARDRRRPSGEPARAFEQTRRPPSAAAAARVRTERAQTRACARRAVCVSAHAAHRARGRLVLAKDDGLRETADGIEISCELERPLDKARIDLRRDHRLGGGGARRRGEPCEARGRSPPLMLAQELAGACHVRLCGAAAERCRGRARVSIAQRRGEEGGKLRVEFHGAGKKKVEV